MPAKHNIDDKSKLLITTWIGEANDREMIEAMAKYQKDIRSKPAYKDFHEIVDFTQVTDVKVTPNGLRRLGQLASQNDHPEIKTKIAYVVNSPVGYGLTRMYETYRSLIPRNTKILKVFKCMDDALNWISQP